jgi:hypothetical protein
MTCPWPRRNCSASKARGSFFLFSLSSPRPRFFQSGSAGPQRSQLLVDRIPWTAPTQTARPTGHCVCVWPAGISRLHSGLDWRERGNWPRAPRTANLPGGPHGRTDQTCPRPDPTRPRASPCCCPAGVRVTGGAVLLQQAGQRYICGDCFSRGSWLASMTRGAAPAAEWLAVGSDTKRNAISELGSCIGIFAVREKRSHIANLKENNHLPESVVFFFARHTHTTGCKLLN